MKRLFHMLVAVVFIGFSSPSSALLSDMAQSIRDEFRNSVSGVEPNFRGASGQQRGFLTGGTIRVRAQNPSDLAITPYRIQEPHFEAGCSGMNLYLGAMSWVSAEELIQQAQSIANPNTLIYALYLAMGQFCEQCLTSMSEWIDKVNNYAQTLRMNCEDTAQFLAQKMGDQAEKIEGLERIGQREHSDGDAAAAILVAGAAEQVKDGRVELGNYIFNEIIDQVDISNWIAGDITDIQMTEIVQSIVGTIIVTVPDDADVPIFDIKKAPMTISLMDFVREGRLTGLGCSDSECLILDPNKIIAEFDPLIQSAYEFLDPNVSDSLTSRFMLHRDIGGNFGTGTSGFVNPDGGEWSTLGESELNFVESSNFPVLALIRDFAYYGEVPPAHFIQAFSELIAIEAAYTLLGNIITQAHTITQNINADASDARRYEEGVREAREKLVNEYTQAHTEIGTRFEGNLFVISLIENLRGGHAGR